jgi:hypothetical protein
MGKYLSICFFSILFLTSCDSNKKLNQENAEKAIKEFTSTHSIGEIPGLMVVCRFTVEAIIKIEPLAQFSETEATTIVHYKCERNLDEPFQFVFKRNIDKHWVLTNIQVAPGNRPTNGEAGMLQKLNESINIIAQ